MNETLRIREVLLPSLSLNFSLETSISPFAFLSNISAHADGRAYPLSALNIILGISNGQWEVQGASASLNRSQQRGLIIGPALMPTEGNKAEEKK